MLFALILYMSARLAGWLAGWLKKKKKNKKTKKKHMFHEGPRAANTSAANTNTNAHTHTHTKNKPPHQTNTEETKPSGTLDAGPDQNLF